MKFLPLACVLAGSLAAAGQDGLQVIRLNDNSVIRAHVTEMAGGFYIAKSPTLGDLKIPTGNVISIKSEEPAAGTNPEGSARNRTEPAPAGIEALRSAVSSKVQNLAATREGMAAIEQFSQNQEVKALLGDSAALKAIQSGDYETLMKSPAMQRLMDNPQTKSLMESVLGQARQPAPPPSKGEGQESSR